MSNHTDEAAGFCGPYLRPKAAAAYLNLAPSTLWSLVSRGLLPAPTRLSPGVSLFAKSELDAAVAQRKN
jgi:predicted DNA-binding transcriptional regulator AlpA